MNSEQPGPSQSTSINDYAECMLSPSHVILLVLSAMEMSCPRDACMSLLTSQSSVVHTTALFLASEGDDTDVGDVIRSWILFMYSKPHDRLLKVHGVCAQSTVVVVEQCVPLREYLEVQECPLPVATVLEIAFDCIKGLIVLQDSLEGEVRRGMDVPAVYIVNSRAKVALDLQGAAMALLRDVVKLGGRAQFMAPEIAKGHAADHVSDVFSYGIVLWSLATCQGSWTDLGPVDVVTAIGWGERPRVPCDENRNASLMPQSYWDLATQCWLEDRSQRPSLVEIKKSLDEIKVELANAGIGMRLHREGSMEAVSNRRITAEVLSEDMMPSAGMELDENANFVFQHSDNTDLGIPRHPSDEQQGVISSLWGDSPHMMMKTMTSAISSMVGYAWKLALGVPGFLWYGRTLSDEEEPVIEQNDVVTGTPNPLVGPALGVPPPVGYHPYQLSPFSDPSQLNLVRLDERNERDPWRDPMCIGGVVGNLGPKSWNCVRSYVLNRILPDEHRDPGWSDIVVIAIGSEFEPSVDIWEHFLGVFFKPSLAACPQSEHWRTLLKWMVKPITCHLEGGCPAFTDLEECYDDDEPFWDLDSTMTDVSEENTQATTDVGSSFGSQPIGPDFVLQNRKECEGSFDDLMPQSK